MGMGEIHFEKWEIISIYCVYDLHLHKTLETIFLEIIGHYVNNLWLQY